MRTQIANEKLINMQREFERARLAVRYVLTRYDEELKALGTFDQAVAAEKALKDLDFPLGPVVASLKHSMFMAVYADEVREMMNPYKRGPVNLTQTDMTKKEGQE
jgi:hypothetical protein